MISRISLETSLERSERFENFIRLHDLFAICFFGYSKVLSLYEKASFLDELARESDPILPGTFDTGEGILISAEIISHARLGCRYFMILQPFGCLPNHVVGRGMIRKLQELYPQARILALDYDPDVSSTNIENRLQMLVEEARRETVGG